MIKLFRIDGDSLYPLYKAGELVIALRLAYGLHVKPLDIVTFSYKNVGIMIKRVRSIENNQVFVEGTTPDSIDSRVFGTIPLSNISYKILFKIPFL